MSAGRSITVPNAAFLAQQMAQGQQFQPQSPQQPDRRQQQNVLSPSHMQQQHEQQQAQQSPLYPSAVQAGLSPTPYHHDSYARAFNAQPSAYPAPPLLPELSAEELAWLRFVRSHELLPYDGGSSVSAASANASASMDNLGSPSAASQSRAPGKSVGFALLLNRVTGVRIPPHVEARESRASLRFRVQISLFDTESKCFFGRTWSSPLQGIGTASAGGSTIGQQMLYFRHSLYSEYCVAVVEYVLAVVRKEPGVSASGSRSASASGDDEVVVERYGIGWTILNLYGRDKASLGDVNHPAVDLNADPLAIQGAGSESLSESMLAINQSPAQVAAAQAARLKRRVLTRQLWAGTPRALLFLDKVNVATPQSMSDFSRQLTKAVGTVGGGSADATASCQLSYELFLCRALHPFFHLFREHEFLGSQDVLGGLPLLPATNPMGVSRKIGLTRGAVLPQNPRLLAEIALPLFQIKLVAPVVNLPPGFESTMLQAITNIKGVQWGTDLASGASGNSAAGGGEDVAASSMSGSLAPLGSPLNASLDRSIVNRTLVVGIHNGRRYIRAPNKLPLVVAELPNRSGQRRSDDEIDGASTLKFEGEFNLTDLMCAVEGDPALALTFELQYELRWTKRTTAVGGGAATIHAPMTAIITAAWSIAMLGNAGTPGSGRLTVDGVPQTMALQRGPGRTLTNARVYGFSDPSEEAQRRNAPGSIITLTVALESASFQAPPLQPFQQQQQQLTIQPSTPQAQLQQQQLWINPASPGPQRQLLVPHQIQIPHSPQQQQQQRGGMHPPHLMRAVSTPTQQQQQHGPPQPLYSPNHPHPFMPPPQFMQQQQQQQQQQQPFQPYGYGHSGLNLQQAQGLSVGIQAGHDIMYDQHDDANLGASQTAQGNRMGSTQGYAKLLSPRGGSGGGQQLAQPADRFSGSINNASFLSSGSSNNSAIQLSRELSDPLKGSLFSFVLGGFAQLQEDWGLRPVSSIIVGFSFFSTPFYRSPRVPLQVTRDQSFDPYHPLPHQLYNQSDKLLSAESWTSSTNDLSAVQFRTAISPFMHRNFVEYLYAASLEVSVWDGDSLFLLGTVQVPLVQMLRQGRPDVTKQFQAIVREQRLRGSLFEDPKTGADSGASLSLSGEDSDGPVRGRLTFQLTNQGQEVAERDEALLDHTLSNTIPSVESNRITGGALSATSANIMSPSKSMARSGRGGQQAMMNATTPAPFTASEGTEAAVSLNTRINRPSRRKVKAILNSDHVDPALVQTLQGAQGLGYSPQRDDFNKSMSRSMKLSRSGRHPTSSAIHRADILNASLNASMGAGSFAATQNLGQLSAEEEKSLADTAAIRSSNLRKLRAFREQSKPALISEHLRSITSTVRTIHPCYGETVFWEMGFKNPYPSKRMRFRVRIDDPLMSRSYGQDPSAPLPPAECVIVQDIREWMHLKSLYGLSTPTNINMFAAGSEPASSFGSSGNMRRSQDIVITSPSSRASKQREESKDDGSDDAVYLSLEGGETVYIPIKFQSFASGIVVEGGKDGAAGIAAVMFPAVQGAKAPADSLPIRHRIVQINLDSVESSSTISYLRVDVRPRNFTPTETMRFDHWSDEIMRGVIQLPGPQSKQQLMPASMGASGSSGDRFITPSAGVPLDGFNQFGSASLRSQSHQSNLHILDHSRIVKINCSSDEVAFDFVPSSDGLSAEVDFKLRVGSYPAAYRFLLCMYTDPYAAQLSKIVQVVVSSHLRAELAATVGQQTTGRIFLPPTDRVRRVRMCASSPELHFGSGGASAVGADQSVVVAGDPESSAGSRSQAFLLQPGAVNTLDYTYHTTQSGRRSLLIHLVDVDSSELVTSWALFIQAVYPRVSNTFNLTLRVGQGARKAFDYENTYKSARTYVFESSDPARMKLREQVVNFPPLSVRSIHLVLAPSSLPGTDVVFCFVNDEKGKNEECLQFNIQYKL